jgi:hypothetical protein
VEARGAPFPPIVRVLDEDYRHIVIVLLSSGVVGERRQKHDVRPEGNGVADIARPFNLEVRTTLLKQEEIWDRRRPPLAA